MKNTSKNTTEKEREAKSIEKEPKVEMDIETRKLHEYLLSKGSKEDRTLAYPGIRIILPKI